MTNKKNLKKKILSIKEWRNPFIIGGKKLKLKDKFTIDKFFTKLITFFK